MENDMTNLAKLDAEERLAFIRVLAGIANADNHLDDEEKEFIQNIAIVYGLSENTILQSLFNTSEEEILEAAKQITLRSTKLELVKEMCMVAHANKVLEEAEMILLGKVAEAMGVELEKVEQISQWVVDRIIWLEEGKLIFEEV
ncbi:MAG: TerB family tellurite resistance protein [Alphaproteobacteria bacterium]